MSLQLDLPLPHFLHFLFPSDQEEGLENWIQNAFVGVEGPRAPYPMIFTKPELEMIRRSLISGRVRGKGIDEKLLMVLAPLPMWDAAVGQEAEAFSGEGPCGTRVQGLIPILPMMKKSVVPYLGTFLTDVVMWDTVMEDCIEVGEHQHCGAIRVLTFRSKDPPY